MNQRIIDDQFDTKMKSVSEYGPQQRILGLDLARALAVFGMVLVNYKIVMNSTQGGPLWLSHAMGLLEGRAAATFVVLAGIGISLFSREGRLQGKQNLLARDRCTLLKRALFLFIVGLLYTPIWPADILHFYGIYIAVAAFLLASPIRRLWLYAGLSAALFIVLFFFLNYETGWDWNTLSYQGFWTPAGMVRHLFFNGFHPVIPWLSFLLIGMVLGRLELRRAAVQRRVFLWGISIATAAEIVSRLIIGKFSEGTSLYNQEILAAVFGTAPMPPMLLYLFAGGGFAVALTAAAVAIGKRCRDAAWLRPFVATGQLALTLYVAHVVIGMGILQAIGRLENQTLSFALMSAVIFCVLSTIFAHLWQKKHKRGPLEAVMRSLTDPRKQP